MTPIEVGDKLYFVPYEYGRKRICEWREVAKVGRKWLHDTRGNRIDKTTLEVDGGDYSPPGRCFRSKEEYDAIDRLNKKWGKLRSAIAREFEPPEWLSEADIDTAAKALLINVDVVKADDTNVRN